MIPEDDTVCDGDGGCCKDRDTYLKAEKERPGLSLEARTCLENGQYILEFHSQEYCLYHGHCPCQEDSGRHLYLCLRHRMLRYLSLRKKFED